MKLSDPTYIEAFEEYHDTYLHYTAISDKIKPYFVIDNFSYWELLSYLSWFSSPYFTEQPGMDIILHFIEQLDTVLDDDVELEVRHEFANTFIAIAHIIAQRKGHTIRRITWKRSKTEHRRFYQNSTVLRTLIQARIGARHAVGVLRRLLQRTRHPRGDVLFLGNTRFCGKTPEDNLLFGSIIRELKARKITSNLLLFEDLTMPDSLKRMLKEFFLQQQPYIGDYYTFGQLRKNRCDFNRLKKQWQQVKQLEDFRSIFTYRGINFFSLIAPRLELLFTALSYLACDAKNITRTLLDREPSRVMVIEHDESLYGKAVMLHLRKSRQRKTIALSQELIYPGCVHTHVKNTAILERRSPLWRPLPDVKCVWGAYARNVLLQTCNYTSQRIHITGNPRFDAAKRNTYNREEVMEHYGITSGKAIIVIPANANPDLYVHYAALAHSLPDLQFIIKPHYYDKIAALTTALKKQRNCLLLDKQTDLYALLSVANYVLVSGSTAGFEAMLFDKPVFIFDPDKKNREYLPYVKSGAGIRVTTATDIKRTIRKLRNQSFAASLQRKRRSFVTRINYRNDGHATQRVCDAVQASLKWKQP